MKRRKTNDAIAPPLPGSHNAGTHIFVQSRHHSLSDEAAPENASVFRMRHSEIDVYYEENRNNDKGQARWREGGRSQRKGAFFNYVMVYMTISAALITTAGLCLHAILKADSSERRESLFQRSLQRAEHQLRADSRESGVNYESPTSISAAANDATEIQWVADRGILTRTEMRQAETVSADRFLFPAGSQIVMEQGSENSVVIRITEPSVFVTYSQAASGASNLNKPAETATPVTPAHVARPNAVEIRVKGARR
jgi:hypothetical protein